MRILVKMKWVESEDKWHMVVPKELSKSKQDDLIYDFLNCANVKRIFENPRTDKDELFWVEVKRFNSNIKKVRKTLWQRIINVFRPEMF